MVAAAAIERISFVVVVTASSVMTQLPSLFNDEAAVAVVAPNVAAVVVVTMPGSGEEGISAFIDGSSHKSVLSFSSNIKSVKSMFARENVPSSLPSLIDEGNGVPN